MRIETRVDGRCVKEYFKKLHIIYSIFSGICVFMIALLIACGLILRRFDDRLLLGLTAMFLLGLFCAFFLIWMSSYAKTINEHAYDAVYDFTDEILHVETFKNGEKKSEERIDYNDLIFFKVGKNYIYVFLYNMAFYAVDKDDKLIDFLLSKNVKRRR